MGRTYRYDKEWAGKRPTNKGRKSRKQRTRRVDTPEYTEEVTSYEDTEISEDNPQAVPPRKGD